MQKTGPVSEVGSDTEHESPVAVETPLPEAEALHEVDQALNALTQSDQPTQAAMQPVATQVQQPLNGLPGFNFNIYTAPQAPANGATVPQGPVGGAVVPMQPNGHATSTPSTQENGQEASPEVDRILEADLAKVWAALRHVVTRQHPNMTLDQITDKCEEVVIQATLDRDHHRRKDTASDLGISRVTLYNKMKKIGMLPG